MLGLLVSSLHPCNFIQGHPYIYSLYYLICIYLYIYPLHISTYPLHIYYYIIPLFLKELCNPTTSDSESIPTIIQAITAHVTIPLLLTT